MSSSTSKIVSEVVVDGEGSHVAFTFASAASACCSVSAASPAKSPSRKVPTTPGIPSASAKSISESVAPNAGGRTILPHTMSSVTASIPYFAAPLTLSATSGRGIDCPITVNSDGSFSGRSGSSSRVACLPPASVAKSTDCAASPETTTALSSSVTLSTSTPSSSAPSSSSHWRIAAPACRMRGPVSRVLREPNVPMSNGASSVTPMMTSTESNGTESSSATSCAKPVRIPCPNSTLPVSSVTVPSSFTLM